MKWLERIASRGARGVAKGAADYELPHFPVTSLQALEILRDEDATTERIAEALQLDPGLSVAILRQANSPLLGLRQQVGELGHAVNLLGRAAVESLVISIAVRDALPQGDAPGFDPARFWRAGTCRAAVAARLAADGRQRSRIVTISLLSDMAIPYLANRLGDKYGAVLEAWHTGERPLCELEQEAFGWDHPEIGREMCEFWGLPEDLSLGVAGHHGDDARVPLPVRLAAGLGETDPAEDARALAPMAAEALGAPEADVAGWIEAGLEDAGEAAEQVA